MRKNIVLFLFIVCMLNMMAYSQSNHTVIGSKNNQFSIKINNSLNSEITGIKVFPSKIPERIELNTSEVNIERLAANSSCEAQFNFDVKTNAEARSDSIDFIILSKNGNSWHKRILFSITAPNDYELTQNYPNPFNPTTNINYSIPKQLKVTLKVFNILGQNVRTLVDEIKKPGVYDVTFNAIDLASGVYFYTLTTAEYSKTVKMILLK